LTRSEGSGDFRGIVLDNGLVRAVVLPALGGKMSSLIRVASGHEFLLQPEDVGSIYRNPVPGAPFENYDTSGFDECIPTVAACPYPEAGGPFAGRLLPDHGDAWSVSWNAREAEGEIHLEMCGRSLPYVFRKRVRLEGADVTIDYELVNTSNHHLFYLWSAHPLLRTGPGARVILPPEVHRLSIESSLHDRLGRHGETCPWPLPLDRRPNEKVLGGAPCGAQDTADKLFTPQLKQGFCALQKPHSMETIVFRFDPTLVPYAGLWLCNGGWPPGALKKHHTVALEPSSGRSDSLSEAFARGEASRLAPGERRAWWLRIELRSGSADFAVDEMYALA
jgi:galactose mutarotase-like enzyme